MYVEDDVLVRWDTVLAWAADEALLAPLGFQRGFFRTEFSSGKGVSGSGVGLGFRVLYIGRFKITVRADRRADSKAAL